MAEATTLPLPLSPQGAKAGGIQLEPDVLEALHALDHRSLWRIPLFAAIYIAAGLAAWFLAETGVAWYWRLPLYLLAAAPLHGISLFVHEAVHGVLHEDPRWNRAIAIATALPVLQTFTAYRVLHLRHHTFLGQPGDPDHYPNYTRWTWLEFAMHWGRLLAGYPAYVTMIPILGWRQGTAEDRRWIAAEVAMLGVVVGLALWAIPLQVLLHAWLIPMGLIMLMVNIRGMSQHTWLSEAADPVHGSRSILTNPVTRFFMCNENYHLEHHLYPGVPWYRLPALHVTLRPILDERGAPFIGSYAAFVGEFIVGSYQCSPLGRWIGSRRAGPA